MAAGISIAQFPRMGGNVRAGWVALLGLALVVARPAVAMESGERIVGAAEAHVGTRFRGDCSGFVLKVFSQAGVEVQLKEARTGAEMLFRSLHHERRPHPGDLAFFHDTVDRNHNGLIDDPFTHVAIVEKVEGSAVTLIHRGSKGVARLRLDLHRRHDRRLNSMLRFRRRGDLPGTRYLAGELLTGFATVAPPERAHPSGRMVASARER